VIVVMKRGATPEQIQHMIGGRTTWFEAHPIYGTERTVIAAVGEKRDEFRQSLESGRAWPKSCPSWPRTKSPAASEGRIDRRSRRQLGRGNCHVGMIAGPCSVENEEQTLLTARAVKAAGRRPARRAFKPRTARKLPRAEGRRAADPRCRPRGDRAGRGDRGDRRRGRPLVARYADVLQIGARNMQNYRLLERWATRQPCC